MGALTSKPFAFMARPWELRGAEAIDLAGGEGSLLRLQIRGGKILRVLPFTLGSEEWIADSARFSYDGLDRQRLIQPCLFGISSSWSSLFRLIGADSAHFSFYIGPEQDRQTVLMARMLATLQPKFYQHVVGPEGSILAALFSSKSSCDWLEQSNVYFLVGVNLRFENPLLFARLRRQLLLNPLKRLVTLAASGFGFPSDQVINLGTALPRFISILTGSDPVCRLFTAGLVSLLLGRAVDRVVPSFSRILFSWLEQFLPHWFVIPVLPTIAAVNFTRFFPLSSFVGGLELLSSNNVGFTIGQALSSSPLVYAASHAALSTSQSSVLFPLFHSFEQGGSYYLSSGVVRTLVPCLGPSSANSEARPSWTLVRALMDLIMASAPSTFSSCSTLPATAHGVQRWLNEFDPLTTKGISINVVGSFRSLFKFPSLTWPVVTTVPSSSLIEHSAIQALATALRYDRFRNFFYHG